MLRLDVCLDNSEYRGIPTNLPLPMIRMFLFFVLIFLSFSIYSTAVTTQGFRLVLAPLI